MNQNEILKKIAENAHNDVFLQKSGNKNPIQIALKLAKHPICDLERLEIGQSLIPYLRKGENIDTGALRILADAITKHLAHLPKFKSIP